MSFDILDPTVDIHRNYLLEASAGTGKTFAIENLFVRLLQEPFKGSKEALTLDQIGVMTFTKAAARDLKKRIRTNIERKKGEDPRLQAALYSFDQAHIHTLHGFCSRSLKMFSFEGGFSFDRASEEAQTPRDILKQIVHDAFRMELKGISPVQITLLVQKRGYRQEELEEELIDLLEKRGKVAAAPPFEKLFEQFREGLKKLQNEQFHHLEEDFQILLPCLKAGDAGERERSLSKFVQLLNASEVDPSNLEEWIPFWDAFKKIFDPETLNKRKKVQAPLHHPDFFDKLAAFLGSTMELLTSPTSILSTLAVKSQELYRKWEETQPRFSPDNLLELMRKGVEDPIFADKIRKKYHALIVDEFQDTDPVQWEILQKLFLVPEYKGFIYLVGDPKQAIYAFRQGDVYTYLAAAKALGQEAAVSLKTNYRSTPALVDALNTLFASAKNLFSLPRLQEEIPYQSVLAGKEGTVLGNGCKGSLHFMEFEKRGHRGAIPPCVYEAIAYEISQMEGKSIAILVSSSKQGAQIADILKRWNIPSFSQKTPPLSGSPAVKALAEVLQAVAAPRTLSTLKIALGGILIGWNCTKVRELDSPIILESALLRFYSWQKTFREKGFAPFFQEFLHSIECGILEQGNGETLLQNLNQLGELLAEHQAQTHCTVEGLIERLHEIASSGEEGERQLLQTEAAVQIITIHSSKGLEYDVVFTPGLLSPPYLKTDRFVADETGSILYPILNPDSDRRYLRHKEEMEGEKLRLLYVALTRAKERVYIPICLKESGQSPLDLFLQKMEKPFHTLLSDTITLGQIQENYTVPQRRGPHIEPLPPLPVEVPGCPKVLHSFSSLAKTIEHAQLSPLGSPADYQAETKTIHALPAGSDIGNLFHTLFEKIPFNASLAEIEQIASKLIPPGNVKEWSGVISETIYNTYHTPLPLKAGPCPLAKLGDLECYKEMEFCYPYQDGYLKGVIDLIFFHQGTYYLLDWKSNWLGADTAAYSPLKLNEAMQLHNYFLQAAVYRNALECYLRLVDPRPFDQIYGGMFYLFFRGMHPSDQDPKGIFKL